MSAIESEPAAAAAEGAGDQRNGRNGERETNSSPARRRRPAPYTPSFRAFLKQLGETRASSTRGAANCGTLSSRKTASRRTWCWCFIITVTYLAIPCG
ncbi:MAG: hypothetical protein ACLQOO_09395 [Terriglobia bacterium]